MYEIQFLKALGCTIGIELLVLLFLLRKELTLKRIAPIKAIGAGVFASMMTLPYLWFVLPLFIHQHLLYVGVGEVLVFLWEGVFYTLYFSVPLQRGLFFSLWCNLLSFVLGLYLFS